MLEFCVVIPNIVTLLLTGSSNVSGSIILFACLSEGLGQSFALTRENPGRVIQQLLPISWFTDGFYVGQLCSEANNNLLSRRTNVFLTRRKLTNHCAGVPFGRDLARFRSKVRAEKHDYSTEDRRTRQLNMRSQSCRGEKFGSETSA